MARTRDTQQSLFFGRDESWLSFNRRVLEEAQDESNPLLERVKFLAITASNLDEFVEIRVASMLQRIEDGYSETAPDGTTLQQTLAAINEDMHEFVAEQGHCWNEQLQPALRKAGIRVLSWDEMDETARKAATEFYQREADPLLTPITIDPRHPFPRVLNKALCLALLLRSKRSKSSTAPVLGVITVPRALPRLVPLPSNGGTHDFVFLHDLIERNAGSMYRGYEILARTAFRVTRNSNLYFQEEESRNLLETVRAELHNRRKGDAVRLEIDQNAEPEIIERLRINFELDESQVFLTDHPVNLSRLMNLYSATPRPDLKDQPFVARELRLNRKSEDLFDELRHRDILLHHPYDSYDGVVGFIQAAAKDPNVVSIKQTLYRTSADSPIFQALTEAAQTKEVTVVVELTARFDEASNIRWAREMEDAGVQVFHGIVGLKTHCKLALLVRRDPDGVVRSYGHLGTGNYNPVTSRFYTDISLLTSDPDITARMHSVFNYLTAHSESDDYSPLMMAPLTLAQGMISLIHRETEHALAGRPARIIAKMNSLLEPSVINALYDASKAGVQIDVIVRGICSLRPGVKGLSENIRITSIVGRFLEHSRIFFFLNGGEEEVYCGSADWMPRNLFERCEVVFPVRDAQIRHRLRYEILSAYLADTVKARRLQPSGDYPHLRDLIPGLAPFSAQDFFIRVAESKATAADIPPAEGPVEAVPLAPPRKAAAKRAKNAAAD
ncbi:polyphosphate kinase 1 [Silvibacterium dinghuense]|uniref:Polyphosphate kinase n=1 Tax=Silvibacterium dinghuense TaxID=1560006 RepID=A0A4Q1SI86_9BACT|nr:polyphosphate kinase 1 [Silvibacterium dinghuense]RXS96920.1 polyphosphate kinase 1 [Silvibacterium dinghuense]GGG94695.1 polyphosphate kinase [Silvibacterium dinghuense]